MRLRQTLAYSNYNHYVMLDPISEESESAVENGTEDFATSLNLFICGTFP
jgi:hypothetical protein